MAYGWQTDGGMAEYLLCKASSLVKMPDAMSYVGWCHARLRSESGDIRGELADS